MIFLFILFSITYIIKITFIFSKFFLSFASLIQMTYKLIRTSEGILYMIWNFRIVLFFCLKTPRRLLKLFSFDEDI